MLLRDYFDKMNPANRAAYHATVKTNYETWISHTYKDAAGNEVPF